MARIVSKPLAGFDPDSEVRLFEALSQLPDDWSVIHSVAWQGTRGNREGDGEADFVLIHPESGLLVIEAKGGSITLENGKWITTNSAGKRDEIDPFEQATSSKVALHKFIRQRLQLVVPTYHAVAFPFLWDIPELGPAGQREIIIGASELQDIQKTMETIHRHWKTQCRLTAGDIEQIIQTLAPTVSIKRRISDAAYDSHIQILHLTDTQRRAFRQLRHFRKLEVLGGPGTGKTILAFEKARECAERGDRTLMLCYNELLGEQLARDASDEGFTATNFHSFCFFLARSAGLSVPSDKDKEWWDHGAADLTLAAADKMSLRYDAIIIDEAQDFSDAWIEATLLMLDGDGFFYLFSDFEQKLWERRASGSLDLPCAELDLNCRNSDPIARRVSAIVGRTPQSRGVPGPEPYWTDLTRVSDARIHVQRVINRLMREGFKASDVVVLCETAGLARELRESALEDAVFCRYGDSGVCVETVARFKGLEAMAVVAVLDGTPSDPDCDAYVAFSRAKAHLHIIAPPQRRASTHWVS